ncbi:DUF2793 domain-containing protein [Martelella lutilitoris]|uniref:DUF2793 domain-containing protein n=1 Tax=Martelella lutilitoris TaxID=2583532 RepID=A0A7T7KLN2_9HYPH|nr:DUF2793 domain-containing protein [Martelella lutilitoris]QQM30921.1 DUF2793 domain-containing protein [Martelella lutilitoris]
MSDQTTRLGLPFILPAQAQKHVTHNEALQRLDAIVHLAISGEDSTPPSSPGDGACHLVAASPTGEWAGHAGALALFQDGYWQFIAPVAGWSAWFVSENAVRVFDGSAWISPPPGPNLELLTLGINAAADATNRLSVSAPATLFNNAGSGHQLKINKATAGDTASLLYQTGWSGRAEMGLSGSDSFAIKTSPDGASWHEAVKITPEGAVSMPSRPLARAAAPAGSAVIAGPANRGFGTLHVGEGGFTLGAAVTGGGNRLVFPASGYYAVSLTVTATAAGSYWVALEKNGSDNCVTLSGIATGGNPLTHSASAISYFSAGDHARLAFSGTATYAFGYGQTEMTAMLL